MQTVRLREGAQGQGSVSGTHCWWVNPELTPKRRRRCRLQVTTIFSASNYYEIGSNKGAYLKLNPQLDSQFVQFTAAASKSRKLTFRQRIGLVESSALRELGARLRECGNDLEREFAIRDTDGTGETLIQIVYVFEAVCSVEHFESLQIIMQTG